MKRSHKSTVLDDDAFERLWNECRSAEQVGYILGNPVDTVRHRATRLRQAGRDLKPMRKSAIDVEALVNITRMLRGEVGDSFELSPTEFVILWEMTRSANKMARLTGMTAMGVRTRVREYRESGVPLGRVKTKKGPRARRFRNTWVKTVSAAQLGANDQMSLDPREYL